MKIIAIEKLLTKNMDRKEFLLFLGLVLITVIGIPGFMNSIAELIEPKRQTQGFGSGTYGGVKQKGDKLHG
jgi:hypothetical protein